jgi:RimJ/RimL family protein N-acetyltransferase
VPPVLKKLFVSLKTSGLRRTLFWVYFGYLKSNTFLIYARNINDPFPEIPHKNDISVKYITPEELRIIRKNNPKLPEEFYNGEFAGSKICFVGWVGEKIAHITWVFVNRDRSRFFTVSDNEAEINYIHTIQEFRGLNLYPLTVEAINRWLKERNFKQLYVASHETNISSIKAIKKCGFKRIGEIRHFSFWRPKWKGTES